MRTDPAAQLSDALAELVQELEEREEVLGQDEHSNAILTHQEAFKRWIRMAQEASAQSIPYLCKAIHQNSRDKGFWDPPQSGAEFIALVHSEVSEALEAMRHGNPPSQKIPDHSQVEEELADVVIRIMDRAGGEGLDLLGAIKAKMDYNEGRAYKHGKEF